LARYVIRCDGRTPAKDATGRTGAWCDAIAKYANTMQREHRSTLGDADHRGSHWARPVFELQRARSPPCLPDEFLRGSLCDHRRRCSRCSSALDSHVRRCRAVERQARIVWINAKYMAGAGTSPGVADTRSAPRNREVTPETLMREVCPQRQPILLRHNGVVAGLV